MNGRIVLIGLPIVLVVAILAGIGSLPQAHALGYPSGPGTICLLDSGGVASLAAPGPCQALGPYTFDAPYPSAPQTGPTQLRVGVYVNGSAGLDGFDVILASNSSVLQPAGFDLTNSVLLGTPQVLLQCQGLVLVQGSICSSADTANTFEVSAASALGQPLTSSPTTGLLFTAIYNVVGIAPAGGVSVGFQMGCVGTSVSDGTCVTVANGTASPVAEAVQTGALFNNFACATTCTIPWVAVTTDVTTVTVHLGASTGNGVAVIPLAENSWPGISNDIISLTATASPGFAAPTFPLGNTCSPGGTSTPACPVVLDVSTVTGGTYTVTLYGTYVATDTTGTTDTLVGTTIIQVNVQAVSWTINSIASSSSQTLYMASGASNPMSLFFTAQSLGGYSGQITYGTASLADGGTGLAFTCPATFALGSGQTITQTVSATATSYGTSAAHYQAYLATSAPTLNNQTSATLIIHVTGFGLTVGSSTVAFAAFGSASDSLTLQSLPASSLGFAGKVVLSKTVIGGPLTVTCPASLTLTAGGTATGSCSLSGSTPGTYTVTIKGVGGTNNDMTNTTTITVTVSSSTPSFSITAAPVSLTSPVNLNPFSTIKVTASGGLSGTVILSETSSPSTGITCTFSNTGIPLPSGTVTFSCSSASAGTHLVTVTGVDGSVSNSVTLTFTFTDFAVAPSTPVTIPCSTGATCTTTIAVTSLNGFAGSVSLVPNPSAGLTATLASSNLLLSSGGLNMTLLSVSASAPGTYTVTVTGTSGSLSHTTAVITVVVTTPDFTITASPTTITFNSYSGGISTITITGINSFTGTVTLTATASSGITAALTPTSINTSGSSTLVVNSTITGTFNVNVTGTSGSLSHTVTITVVVSQGPRAPMFIWVLWTHHLSLSNHSNTATQNWFFGVYNPNSAITVYYKVQINGIDSSGSNPFTLTSGVTSLSPHHFTLFQNLSKTFTLPTGVTSATYTFSAIIYWGTTTSSQPFTTNGSVFGFPTSGSFTITQSGH